MKNKSTAIIAAAIFCATGAMTVKASSGLDLILGFTQNGGNSGGNDFMIDIGPVIQYPGATKLHDGETWSLNSQLAGQNFNLANVKWGVIGDGTYGDGISPQTLWVTTSGNIPPSLPTDTRFAQADAGISSIEELDFGGGSSQNQTSVVPASGQNSWGSQTVSGSLGTQFVNAYQNPNVTGVTSDTLWQVAEGSAPVELGTFTLSGGGVVTFNVVSTGTPPAPKIVNVTRIGNTSTVYFSTTNGTFTYALYYSDSLQTPVSGWTKLPTTLTGNGLTNTLSDTTTDTNRFYMIGVH